jgi:hypothetical protein
MADEPQDQPKPQDKPADIQARWLKELERASKYNHEFYEAADKIIRLYRKQGDQTRSARRKFAMLWSNSEILKPALYAQTPKPEISRRFKDKDPPGMLVGTLLERVAAYQFECGKLDDAMKLARDDLILPGRGIVWVRRQNEDMLAFDYIHWRDFLFKPGRNWSEVTWVGKRSYFSKPEMKERFKGLSDSDLGGMAPDNVPKQGLTDAEKKALEGKYSVWEIWDRTAAKVFFIAPSGKKPLEVADPLYTLKGFWPCPRPLFATLTSDSLIPVPDYRYYQDQAEEIDDLTRRIASLTDSLKLVGFYPKGAEDSTAAIETALSPNVENKMIGIESWAAFGERGGANAIIFLPIKQVADTITACVELRRQLIDDVYQITGLSDILRGATDPNETLGAQEIKTQTGSLRIRDRQQDIQRFARDLLHISCEIMAEAFEPQQLLEMANMLTPEYQQKQEDLIAAFQLLKDDRLRSFRIDIETDSTIQPDENTEKQRRIEFATAIGSMMKEAMPMAQAVPDLLPLIGQVLLFVTRGFRTARELEDTIEKTIQSLEQKAQAAAQQPPQPGPEEVKAQAAQQEAQMRQQQMQAEMAMKQQDGQMRQQERGQELEHKQTLNQMELEHERAKFEQQQALAAQQTNQDLLFGQQTHRQTLDQQAEAAQAAQMQAEMMAQQKLQQSQAEASQGLRNSRNQAIMTLAAKRPAGPTNGAAAPEIPPEIPPEIIEGQQMLDPIDQIAQAFQAAMQQVGQLIMQGNQQLMQAIQAPKSITTPDGRTYTAQPQIAGGGQNGAANPNL